MAENAQDKARQILFEKIAEATESLHKLNTPSQASALKDLAEAYAWLTSANQPH